MKILMLSPQPFFEPRGTPISVYQRLEALSALGHKVDLVTYHVGAMVEIENVSIHRIPHAPFVNEVKIGPSWIKPFLDLLLFQLAFLMLLKKRYDVLHTHEEAAFLGVLLSALFRVPHLYDMHSSLPRQLSNFDVGNWRPLIKMFEWLERLTLNSCDAVITIDAELEQYVQSINPRVAHIRIENHPIPVKGSLVDIDLVERLKSNHGVGSREMVVYTGTFERYQGLELLLRSARIVRERNQNVVFVLVGGKATQIEQMQAFARREQVEDAVIFVGIVAPDEALAFLSLADVLVSPRTGGAFVPLKIYSYLSSGKPTVATRVPAHAEVLNEEIAFLVEPEENALAQGILTLLGSSQERRRLGERAREHAAREYNAAEYTARLEKIYKLLPGQPAVLAHPQGGLEGARVRQREV